MYKQLLIFFTFFFCPLIISAQAQCTGTILSDKKEPLANVSVIVKDTEGIILQYTFTNTSGIFTINIEGEGNFIVEANKIGYIQQQLPLIISRKIKSYKLDFQLEENSELLEDLIIEINNPIQQKGDTLIYDAKSFTTGREIVVEDLLKNIPGITVEKDGKIKFENIEIEKVMVEGDDFFNRGYSLLTKNMPNKPLDKIEILRKYSHNKLLKGIEESNKVALNLTIDEAYKDIWFGDITTGYGLISENRYEVSGNLMNFNKKYKNFITSGLNNIGIDKVGSLEGMFYNNSEIESIGDRNQLYNIMNLYGERAGGLKDHRTRINNSEHISLSSIFSLSKKLKIKTTGFLGFDENYANNSRYNLINTGNTSFENNENNQFKGHLKKGYINLLATYDISRTQLLQINSTWNQGNTYNENNLIFNGISTLERLETKNVFIDQKITYSHKWNEKNVVLIKARYFSNKIPQFYTINDYLMGDLFSFNPDSMNNNIHNDKIFGGLESDLKIRLKNNDLIDLKIGYEHSYEKINTVFQLFDGQSIIQPDDFQTSSSFMLGDLYIKSAYTLKYSTFKLSTHAELHQLLNRFNSLNSNKKQQPFYINPSIDFIWDIKPNHVLSGLYRINFINTSFTQVNDTYLLSSSRSFSKGLGTFKLTDYQYANIGYNIRHYLNRYRFSINLNYSKQSNVLSNRILLEQNSSLSEYIFIKGGDSYGVNLVTNFYFKKLNSHLKLDANYSYSTSFNEINDSGLRKNIYTNQRYSFEWRSNFKSNYNFLLGTEWTFSKINSPSFQDTNTNGLSFIELYYKIDERLEIKAINEYYYFGRLNHNQRNHLFLDVEATYKFKSDKYTLSIRANNLFNKQNFTTYYISDLGYSTTNYRLMPRYLLLSYKYRFSL